MKTFATLLMAILALPACSDGHDVAEHEHDHAVPETRSVEAPSNPVEEMTETLEDKITPEAATVRSVEAHDHGAAELAIVLEGNQLTVELDTPIYNLVGFEHAPQNATQREVVTTAQDRLSQPEDLFVFTSSAGCKAQPLTDITAIFVDDMGHGHDDSEEDNHHDDHHEEDEHADEDHGDHADYLITYTFTCVKPDALSGLSVALFEAFPNMTDIDGVYLGPDRQGSFVLSPNKPEADLRP